MTRRASMAAALIFLAAGFAVAATQKSAIDGRWEETILSGNTPVTLTYIFKVKGQVLTGTDETPSGSETITEGKVNGDRISFKTSVGEYTIKHRGTVRGDTLHLRNFGPHGEFDQTYKRVRSGK